MFKRCLSMMFVIFMLIVSSQSIALAGLNDDDYKYVWGRGNTGYYIVKSSINCEQYNPPYYILSADVGGANIMSGNINSSERIRIYYDYDNRTMYKEGYNGDWVYMPPNGSNGQSGMKMYVGEAIFYMNYSLKFYGSLTNCTSDFKHSWYSKFD